MSKQSKRWGYPTQESINSKPTSWLIGFVDQIHFMELNREAKLYTNTSRREVFIYNNSDPCAVWSFYSKAEGASTTIYARDSSPTE